MKTLTAYLLVFAMLLSMLSFVPTRGIAASDGNAADTVIEPKSDVPIPGTEFSTGKSQSFQKSSLRSQPTSNPVTLFAFEYGDSQNSELLRWVSFSSNSPWNLTPLSQQQTSVFTAAEYVDGTLYAVCDSYGYGQFGRLDPDTYAFTPIGSSFPYKANDIAYDYVSGQLFAICSNQLFTIDIKSGEYTLIGDIDLPNDPIALAASPTGQLYIFELGTDFICSLDKYTADVERLGHTGATTNYAQSATFDQTTGILYLANFNTTGALYTVDTQTFEATLVGSLGQNGSELVSLHIRDDSLVAPVPLPVTGITLLMNEAFLPSGQTLRLDETLYPENSCLEDRTVVFSSSDTNVASVNDLGFVTAHAPGVATITAETANGLFSDECELHVMTYEESLFKLDEALNVEGGNLSFSPSVNYPFVTTTLVDGRLCGMSTNQFNDSTTSSIYLNLGNVVGGSTISFDWASQAENYYDGLYFKINGEQKGAISYQKKFITFEYTFEKSENCTLEWSYIKDASYYSGLDTAWVDNICFVSAPESPVTGVTLTPPEMTLYMDQLDRLEATVLPLNASDPTLDWTISDPSVISVNTVSGLVTPLSPGTATVTVTTREGGFSASSVITIKALDVPGPHTELDYSTEIGFGSSEQFLLERGKASLIFIPNMYGQSTDQQSYAKGFYIDMNENEYVDLATSCYLDSVLFVFDTDFNCIAQNNDNEASTTSFIRFHAQTAGRYYILVCGAAIYHTGTVTLSATQFTPTFVQGITLQKHSVTLGLNRFSTLYYSFTPGNPDDRRVYWSSSDESIVSVNASGNIYGVSEGTATITVTTNDGSFSDSAKVTVDSVSNPAYDGKLYTYKLVDSVNQNVGLISFFPDNPDNETVITASNLSIYAGEYYNGLYYCFSAVVEMFFQELSYLVIDPSNGSIVFSIYNVINICYDMAYDYHSSTMYGITNQQGTGLRSLCRVNMLTGELLDVTPFSSDDDSVIALACDNYGNLLCATSAGNYCSVDKYDAHTEVISSLGVTAQYIQTMAYDHTSNMVYYAHLDETTSNLFKINPLTGAIENRIPRNGVVEYSGLFAYIDPQDITTPDAAPIPLEGFTTNDTEINISTNRTYQIVATFNPQNASDKRLVFSSNNPGVAQVNARGEISGISPGVAFITITSVDGGYSATVKAFVKELVGPLTEGQALITLDAPDLFEDGSGYQMLLDADANVYERRLVPLTTSLTLSGDADPYIYDQFEYKIPENADGSTITQNTVSGGTITIAIPAGTYDYVITNPTPYDRIYIANNGRGDNVTFEAGYEYTFKVRIVGFFDNVSMELSYAGFVASTEPVYTVTFLGDDGAYLGESTVYGGQPAVAPIPPARDGYTFVGWSADISHVTENMTVTAVYRSVEEEYQVGDVNLDGQCNTGDAAYLLRYAAQLVDMTPQQLSLGDYNNDGEVNTGDAAAILRVLAGLDI